MTSMVLRTDVLPKEKNLENDGLYDEYSSKRSPRDHLQAAGNKMANAITRLRANSFGTRTLEEPSNGMEENEPNTLKARNSPRSPRSPRIVDRVREKLGKHKMIDEEEEHEQNENYEESNQFSYSAKRKGSLTSFFKKQ